MAVLVARCRNAMHVTAGRVTAVGFHTTARPLRWQACTSARRAEFERAVGPEAVAPSVARVRRFASVEKVPDGPDGSREHWDLENDEIIHRFTPEDLERFSADRVMYRQEPRLQSSAFDLPVAVEGNADLDWPFILKGVCSALRINDLITEPFRDLCIERVTEQGELMEHFGIPALENKLDNKPLHNKNVPGAGTYEFVRKQSYWLALHVWLIHAKQHQVQADEWVLGSVLCALITRRIFDWQWNQLRGWMYDWDVPTMSLTAEVQDLQEYIFGFCVALDGAFKEEAPDGTVNALALDDASVPSGRHGIAAKLKYVLWANVYSGTVPHDSQELHELTIYMLRQRAKLEAVNRAAFFTGEFTWAEFPRLNPGIQ